MATNIVLKLINSIDSLTQDYKGNAVDDAMKCGFIHKTDNADEVVNVLPFLCATSMSGRKDFVELTLSNEELLEKQNILRSLDYAKVNEPRDLVHVNDELIDKVKWCTYHEYPYQVSTKTDTVLIPSVVDSPKYKDNYYMNGYLFEKYPEYMPEEFKTVDLDEYNKLCAKFQSISIEQFSRPLKITPETYLELSSVYSFGSTDNDYEKVYEILSKDNSFVNPDFIMQLSFSEANDIPLSMRNGQRQWII